MDSPKSCEDGPEIQIGSFTLTDKQGDKISHKAGRSRKTAVIPIIAKIAKTKNPRKSSIDDLAQLSPSEKSARFALGRRSSAFTEELPLAVELDFHREGWLNRIVTDKTGKLLYFADISWKWTGTSLDIYRSAPGEERAIASLSRKSLNKRMFYDLQQEETERIKITGSGRYLGCDYYFEHAGRKYHWREGRAWCMTKQHNETLSDIETGEVIARFKNASLLQVWKQKNYGKLVIYSDAWKENDKMLDLLVFTLVAVKQRIREKRRVRALWKVLTVAADAAGN